MDIRDRISIPIVEVEEERPQESRVFPQTLPQEISSVRKPPFFSHNASVPSTQNEVVLRPRPGWRTPDHAQENHRHMDSWYVSLKGT